MRMPARLAGDGCSLFEPPCSHVCAQIVIEGFKSYKDQTIAEPFSPHINVIGAWGPQLACQRHSMQPHGAWWHPAACIPAPDAPPTFLIHVNMMHAVGANGSGKSNFFHGERVGAHGCPLGCPRLAAAALRYL